MRRLAAAIVLVFSAVAAPAQNPDWVRPFEAHRVIGNLYYVGTYDLACYLITSDEGHILINTGLPDSATLIKQSVESLGFAYEDIAILLTMQAHWDHVGALKKIEEQTGAEVFATAADAKLLESGGFDDWLFGGRVLFAPVEVDRILEHGDAVTIGDARLEVMLTPGHTTGSSSYAMQVTEGGKQYDVLIANMNSINPGVTFLGNTDYPTITEDFATTFARQKEAPVDVWVAAHASQYGLHEKYKPGDAYDPERFVDPEGYRRTVRRYEMLYLEQLEAERGE